MGGVRKLKRERVKNDDDGQARVAAASAVTRNVDERLLKIDNRQCQGLIKIYIFDVELIDVH